MGIVLVIRESLTIVIEKTKKEPQHVNDGHAEIKMGGTLPGQTDRIVQSIKKRADSRYARCPMVDAWLMDTGFAYDLVSANHVQNVTGYLEHARLRST